MHHRGADRALACDHYGNAAVAYYDGNDQALRYCEHVDGSGWAPAWIDWLPADVGMYPSLAFDRYERPAISYYELSPGLDLKYAWYDGSSWKIKVVDSAGDVGRETCLAFDLYGRPAIAYCDSSDLVKLAYDQDGDGNFTVEVIGITGRDPTLAFDSQNRPRIAFRWPTADYVGLATKWNGGWVFYYPGETISGAPTLAIDPDTGDPALAFVRASDGDLVYMEWDGYGWHSQTVDTGTTDAPSLAFDPADGRPAIAYEDNRALEFAWFDGSVWHTQTVDASAGKNPSLAFNQYGDGWPVIAYFNGDLPSHLYVIQDPPGVPEPATVVLVLGGAAFLRLGRRRRGANDGRTGK